MDKTSVFLGEFTKDSRFAKTIDEAHKGIPQEITGEVPPNYHLGSIADTIARHASAKEGVGSDAYHGETPQIRTTQVTFKDDTEARIRKTEGQEKKRPKRQPRPHVQWPACQQYVHNKQWDFLPKLFWSAKLMKDHPAKTQQMAESYKGNHRPKNIVKVHAVIH